MSYTKQTWETGDIITAEKLNHMEDGIAGAGVAPSPATDGTPAMDGTAARGTSTDYARKDHVHPTDTSRAAAADLANKSDKPTVVSQTAPTSIELADNTEYYLTNVSSLTLTFPVDYYWECWISLNTASSGAVTVDFPSAYWIGEVPTFGNSEMWEVSIKDGTVTAAKAEYVAASGGGGSDPGSGGSDPGSGIGSDPGFGPGFDP